MAETLKAPPQGIVSGKLAELLKSGKESLNKYEVKEWVPLLGGTGVGDIFLGEAPELVEDISYEGIGALFTGGNVATGGLGTLSLDKRTADVAFLGADLIGVGSGLKALGKAGIKKAAQEIAKPTTEGRREFMKKTGAVTAGLTVGAGMLKVMGKEGAEQTAKRASDNVVATTVKKYKYNTLDEYLEDVENTAIHEIRDTYPNEGRNLFDKEFADIKAAAKKRRLELDEAIYNEAKNIGSKDYDSILNQLSPQAKEELAGQKALAKEYRIPWTEYIDVTQPF